MPQCFDTIGCRGFAELVLYIEACESGSIMQVGPGLLQVLWVPPRRPTQACIEPCGLGRPVCAASSWHLQHSGASLASGLTKPACRA